MRDVAYAEDEEFAGAFELWNANVERSLAGRKGQAAMRDLEAALLALPEQRLIADDVSKDGEVCAVGAVVAHRKVGLGQAREEVLRELEGDHYDDEVERIGVASGIPRLVAWRLVTMNDLDLGHLSPEQRYARVLDWTRSHLSPAEPPCD